MLSQVDLKLVLAAVGVLVPICFFLLNRRLARKALKYHYSASPLTLTCDELKEHIQITFDGQSVHNASIICIEVTNSGSAEIKRSDFETPLEFRLPEGAAVMGNPEVSERHPRDLAVEMSVDEAGHTIRIEPLLMNSKDRFAVVGLVKDFTGNIEVTGRISAIKDIRRDFSARDPLRRPIVWFTYLLLSTAPIVIGQGIYTLLDCVEWNFRAVAVMAGESVVVCVLFILLWIRSHYEWR